ncbi:Ig-like domain-containing protein [Enterococcus haemoperoxidus]|nr:Ig-like domain-containing protein [Enterococcus haemoperoxidus]
MKKVKTLVILSSLILNVMPINQIDTVLANKSTPVKELEKINNQISEKPEESSNKKNNSIIEQNIYKLNPYMKETQQNFSSEKMPDWLNKQIQSVFYQTDDNQLLTYVDKEIYNKISGIQIHFSDGSFEALPFLSTENEAIRMIEDIPFPILQLDYLPEVDDEATARIQDKIQATSYEQLLIPFGEHVTYDMLDKKFILGDKQVGNNRQIDTVQLESTFNDIKAQSTNVARKIAHMFPELVLVRTDNEYFRKEKLDTITENISELLLVYTFINRWFDYSIGNVRIPDVIFSKSSLFSKTQEKTDFERILDLVHVLKSESFVDQPGNPFLMTMNIESSFLHPTHGLRGKDIGYNISELADSKGKVSIGTMLEFLIRTFVHSNDYSKWFEEQGFVTATEFIDKSVEIEGIRKNIWEAMRTIEDPKSKISPSFLTILLSVKDRSAIIVSNGANTITFGHVNKQLPNTARVSPKELASHYAKNNNRLMKFIWDMADEERKKLLQEDVSNGVGVTFDSGEIEDGKKDVFNPENHYLHDFLLPVSPTVASRSTQAINGIVVQTKPKNILIMGMNNLYSEYTVSHEETHRHKELLNGGVNQRTDIEDTATMAEADEYDEYRLNLNYYYQSMYEDWNRRPPETQQELKNYAQGMLDLNMVWNIEKAKTFFSLPLEEQVGKIYKATDAIKGTFKKISLDELKQLQINVNDETFVQKLVDNNIMLPSVPGDDTITYNLVNGNGKVPFKRDALFNIPYTTEKDSVNSFYGWDQIWHFLAMETAGMEGYIDFINDEVGQKDDSAIKKILRTSSSPKEYWIEKYKKVEQNLVNRKFKLDTQSNLHELIVSSMGNDFDARMAFQKKYIQETDSLFTGIYHDKDLLPIPEVNEIREVDEKITGEATPNSHITAMIGQEILAKGAADNNGNFTLKIAPQKTGTTILVKQETETASSDYAKVIVGHLETNVSNYDELIQAMLDYPASKLTITKNLQVEGKHKDTIVPIFTGSLDGAGHEITGLTHPLIEKSEGATIRSLILNEVAIVGQGPEDSGLGSLTNVLSNSKVKDVHIQGTITTNDPVEVGGITGIASNSQIEESSVTASLAGRDTGGVVGRAEKESTLKNIYAMGEITKGRRVGGVIGNGFGQASLINAYNAMKISVSNSNEANGILGTSYNGKNKQFNLSNTLSLGDVLTPNGYKIQKDYLGGTNQNNYELDTIKGTTSVSIKELDAHIATNKQVKQASFYQDTLKWDTEKIWNTESVEQAYPFLRNSDPRNHEKNTVKAPQINPITNKGKQLTGTAEPEALVTAFVNQKVIGKGKADSDGKYSLEIDPQEVGTQIYVKQQIKQSTSPFSQVVVDPYVAQVTSYDELIQLMLAEPDVQILLKQDLIAEGKYKDTIVPIFKGKLNGNGHSISNLNHTLIEKAEGAIIQSLVLKGVTIDAIGPVDSGIGSLIKESSKTEITDVHIQGTVQSSENVEVGGIIGIASQTSIEESSVNVTLSGRDTGGIVGRATNETKLNNVYSMGKITRGRRVGGLVGNGFDDSQLSNSYSAIKIKVDKSNDSNGILGSSYSYGSESFHLSNTLSLGDVLNDKGYKVLREYLSGNNQNNYELGSAKGKSSTDIKELDVQSVSDKQIQDTSFYKHSLKWDTEKIWNTEFVREEYPFLRNSDPRNSQKVVIESPMVNQVTDCDEVITGNGIQGAEIIVKVGDNEIGKGKVDEEGNFEIKITKQKAETKIKVTQTLGGKESPATEIKVIHLAVKANHIFKKGYWESYGLVLNGQVRISNTNMTSKDSVTKYLELVNAEGKVVTSIKAVNTNWYDLTQYDGYQVILSEKVMEQVISGEYLLQVNVTVADNDPIIVPITTNKYELFGIQDYQDDFLNIPNNNIGIRTVETFSKDGKASLRITAPDQPVMGLISEGPTSKGRFVNGYILNTDFDFNKKHKKNLVIEDKAGKVVKEIQNVHTWDLSTWNLGISGLHMKSGFQIIIPTEYLNTSLYQYKLNVTTEENGKQLEVKLDKIK